MGLEVQGLESMDTGTYTRIRTMIKNRQGLGGGLYVPNNAFHTLVNVCCSLVLVLLERGKSAWQKELRKSRIDLILNSSLGQPSLNSSFLIAHL
jgi:hypothetical protein